MADLFPDEPGVVAGLDEVGDAEAADDATDGVPDDGNRPGGRPAGPTLVVITGPLAAGKNTVADRLAEGLVARGRTVVIADVDEVAAMVGPPGAAAAGLWFAAHEAHGALVGQWMRSAVDHVVAVGPFFDDRERAALTRHLPDGAATMWVVVDAPVSVTLPRAQADPTRGLSRDPRFHRRTHRRFRDLLPTIPADHVLDSGRHTAAEIAAVILSSVLLPADGSRRPPPGRPLRPGRVR